MNFSKTRWIERGCLSALLLMCCVDCERRDEEEEEEEEEDKDSFFDQMECVSFVPRHLLFCSFVQPP